MKNLLLCFTAITIAITCSSLSAIPAFAVVKKAPISTPPKASTNAPLTEGECTKLGGTVSGSNTCNSGSMCETTDENGKSHHVCISARKK
jgi:hypothetical protein